MIFTKEQQENLVSEYVREKHNTDECTGFIDGINATIKLINKLTIPDSPTIKVMDKIVSGWKRTSKYPCPNCGAKLGMPDYKCDKCNIKLKIKVAM